MRFSITALGSAGGRSVGQVVDDIVRYLEGPKRPPPTTGQPTAGASPDGPSQYYADGNAEAGRWLGNGAAEMGLCGQVDGRDFARVLAGRDPHTGVRLITAQGSAGRRPTLARGTHTRWGADSEPLYDIRDAAAALRLEVEEAERLVAAGEAAALRRFVTIFGVTPPTAAEFEGAYLVPTIDADGTRWVSEAELQRCEAARAAGPDPDVISAAGAPEDLLPLAEAARLAGVSAQYLRGLAGRWERHREAIEVARAEGKEPGRQYLVAYRGTKRQWLVRRSDLVDYLRRRRRPSVRVGFDLTLTTEKSLGVLALLGDDATRATVLDAIQAGNDRGMVCLEYAAAMVRDRGEPVSTRGWTVASFRHLTSRALDPFPHHHNVVANTAADPDGRRRALDARFLYRHAGEASALATAEMRCRLTTAIGVRWRRGRKGGWEIDGIPDEVLQEFSRRSNEIDDAVAELENLIGRTSSISELRGLVVKTRPAKRRADPEDLVAGWWARARALGFTPALLRECVDRQAPSADPEPEMIFTRLAAPDGLCATGSIFTRADVLAAINEVAIPLPSGEEGPLLLSADDLEALANDFLASDHVVELLPTEGQGIKSLADVPAFTTAEMLGVQARILDRWRAGRAVGSAQVGESQTAQRLGEHPELTDEQRELVAAFCTSGDRAQAGIGRAGAGKTTAMRAAADVWAAAGFRVFGGAVKGEAARHLGNEACIPSETLAWHLAHTDPATSPLDARSVLIVDEASTVSDRDLDRLLWLAEQTGAAIRLVGDPAQHGAVAAGGMFAVLCERDRSTTPELASSHRVADPHDRAAAEALRDGRVADALGELEAAGHLQVVADEVELYLNLLDRWWASRAAGNEHPMVDRRNHTRFQLNRVAHRLLQATGEVGAEEVAVGDRRFSVGDRVVARRGDRGLHPAGRPMDYVRNGARGTIVAVSVRRQPENDKIRVDFDGLGEIELSRTFLDEQRHPGRRVDVGLDHAYAVTSYAVQGATFTESTSRIDENTSRAEAYVDITRGRQANHLYLTRAGDPLAGERLPRAPAPSVDASVRHRLTASGPERAALDVDPAAPTAEVASPGRGADHAPGARTDVACEPAAHAAERRARQVSRIAPRRLDSDLLVKLPRRSDIPYLAHGWDQTVAKLGAYLDRWGVRPGGEAPWEWLLGPRSGHPLQDVERQDLRDRVIDLTAATAAESLRSLGQELPPWSRAHLAHQAAQGRCMHSRRRLFDLYQRIESYRRSAGVTDDVPSMEPIHPEQAIFGGDVPLDRGLRSRRRALLAETLLPPAHGGRTVARQ